MIIELKNITKIFQKEIVAIDNLSLSFSELETVAIIGSSGCGKSTLLNILGLLESFDGEYMLCGENIKNATEKKKALLRNQRIGYVFQNGYLDNDATVYENVEVPLIIGGKKKYKEKVLQAIEQVGLLDKVKTKVSCLSGGQRQRVAIARALINDPEIILADEPTGALDSTNSSLIMDLLLSLKQLGKTIIVVTHDLALAQRCERIVQIKDGRVISDEKPSSCSQRD